jgi:deazaflavin-dependent oxidoreductase (nitroreductase family)
MTTSQSRTARTPPRFLVRIFWAIHRAMYSLSGGRVGLARPNQGKKFGTLRLNTVGRRSGQPRSAMVGYFEDGPNLITLAMNGWADAEPAWWLNLQASPDITVDLPEGKRAVRARAATGAERDRLWVKFRDYPGWGDTDAFAARRSGETAVVVLEPRPAVE